LGRYPANVLAAPGALPATVPLPAVGLPARLVARRPDLAAAEARYAAAVRTTGAARKLRYPRLALTGSLGTASQELGELLDDDLGVWNLVGNLTAPVFQGGRIAAQIEAAAAEEEAALESFAATLLNAYQEVETALASDRSLASRRALLEALVREADAAEDLAWEQYAKGLIEIITVLDTQRLAFTQRSQLLTLRNRQIQNRLSLVLALGGAGRPMAAAD
ncbi:MAG: TolC family protein, partial [Verrucomicrobiota bacterium]